MDFYKIKNKIKRAFHSFHIGTLGAIVCSAQLLLELYAFALDLFLVGFGNDFTSLIFLAINCVFDLYLVRYFITAKENNSLAPARLGIIFLLISNYVLPAIRTGLESLFTNSLGIALFSIIISGMVLGVVYFILLVLENKRIGKHNHLIMAIIGALMVLFGLGQGGTYIAIGAISLIETVDVLYDSLYFIYFLLSGLVTIGMSVIFFLYPIFAIRESKRGY